MAQGIEERLERLEQLLGLAPDQGGEPLVRDSDGDRLRVAGWLQARRKPGETVSAVVVLFGGNTAESITAWAKEEQVAWAGDVLRRTASIAEALSSEVRLRIVQTLLDGPKSTAQLLEAVALDRSQLYHHLRDLFVHGLVEQPERGSYEATLRGQMLLLLAGHLAMVGPETLREAPELDLGD